tara:strand:- start:1083 stop:1439 length:357 start_codon:yes stop_codon:yes gene_type:complete
MKIKWERNSRALSLAAQGKIKNEDIIPRMKTVDFPADMATVRLAKPTEPKPFVTVHIRGKEKEHNNGHGYTWVTAETCRVNLGGYYDKSMCSNGILDEDLDWKDVHKVVEEVKETLDL